MKFIQFMFLLGILGVSSVAVSDQATEKEAEKLLNTMAMESTLEHAMSQMLDIQLQQNPALVPYKGVMLEFFEKHMSYDSMKPEMVKIYAEAFTVSELKEINAFYSTEVGKKTIEKIPTLMSQGAQIGATRVQANIGELEAMIEAESERIQSLQQQ